MPLSTCRIYRISTILIHFNRSGCRVRYVNNPDEIGNPDLIIIPGNKCTIADLDHLRKINLDLAIIAKRRVGIPIIGICGGYQMLGKTIHDPDKIESPVAQVEGLGLLNIETSFFDSKTTAQVRGCVITDRGMLENLSGVEIEGYEIHMGQTDARSASPVFRIARRTGDDEPCFDGTVSEDGLCIRYLSSRSVPEH